MEKYIEQLKPLFAQVAEKIGEGAQFGWYVVIKQQYVEGAIGLFWAMLGVIGFITIWKLIIKSESNDISEGEIVFSMIVGITSFVAFVGGSITAITHFINPEYYALEFFINLVK